MLRFVSTDIDNGDIFGSAIHITGSDIIVGAPGEDGLYRGAAYVFTINADGTVTQQQKLLPAVRENDSHFGHAVCIFGDTALVGCPNKNNAGADRGSVYVFRRVLGVWAQTQELVSTVPADNELFGRSVAIYGTYAAIGAPTTALAGSVYMIRLAAGVWGHHQVLTASDAAAGDRFGTSADMDGSSLIVGAPYDAHSGKLQAGSAYVFVELAGVWGEQQKLIGSAPGDIYRAGNQHQVSIQGDTAILGRAYAAPAGNWSGDAKVFSRSGAVWTETQTLVPTVHSADDTFGSAVALSGNTIVIGSVGYPAGAIEGCAYIFERVVGSANFVQRRFIQHLTPAPTDWFGYAVSIYNEDIVIGAPYDDDFGNGSGTSWLLSSPRLAVRRPISTLYVDNTEGQVAADAVTLLNQIPTDGETDVKIDAAVNVHVVSTLVVVLTASVRIWITSSADGLRVLAYDQAAGGFQAGFSGTATYQASPGSGVIDELLMTLYRTVNWESQATITVEVQAVAGVNTLSESYEFTIEDVTPPEIINVLWLTPRRCRIEFDGALSTVLIPGGSLFLTSLDEGIEIIDTNKILSLGTVPLSSWVGEYLTMTGSVYPRNNRIRKILSVTTSPPEITVDNTDHGDLVNDDGLDKDNQGSVIRERRLRGTISPWQLEARLFDEETGYDTGQPERIQCTYCPMPVASSLPESEDLPAGRAPAEYVVIDWHDDISIRRMYTLRAYGLEDAVGNALSIAGDSLEFTSPGFGIPEAQQTMWDLVPEEHQLEDMNADGLLRRMCVVLQDMLNVLRYRVQTLETLDDPNDCPSQWLNFLLYDLGSPFRMELTETKKRKLAGTLHQLYKKFGLISGLEATLKFFLGYDFDVKPFQTTLDVWRLGYSWLGGGGEDGECLLGPGTAYARNCYEIISSSVLTDEESVLVRQLAEFADPCHMHLVRIVEP